MAGQGSVVFALVFFFSTQTCATDPQAFWTTYPACAVSSCLVPITNSFPCETNDNKCVCTTASFVKQIASCLGSKCINDVFSTYDTYQYNCQSNGGYSLALSERDFFASASYLISYLQGTFWTGYPDCAKAACLAPLTATSGCEITSNECVCGNATLVTQVAECVGTSCASSVVPQVYSQYSEACATNGGYSLALSSSAWDAAAGFGPGSAPASSAAFQSTAVGTAIPTGVGSSAPSSTPQPPATSNQTTTTLGATLITSTTRAIPATFSTGIPSTTTSGTQPTESGAGGLNKDQGIAIGFGVVGAIVGAFAIYGVYLQWKQRKRNRP